MTQNFKIVFILFFLTLSSSKMLFAQSSNEYDIVLTGGRVIDPETNLDAIKNVGIIGNSIAEISSDMLIGKQTIDVNGLVVAPGFIDMHVHGRSNKVQKYQVHDGVTTALELEWGIEFLKEWYATRASKALINYGASVCWPFERFKALEKYDDGVDKLYQGTINNESGFGTLFDVIRPSFLDTLSSEDMERMRGNIKTSLDDGGIGIGVPIGYLPESDPEEMFEVFKLAGRLDALIYSHVRQPNILAIQEVLANASLTEAPLHIVHVNSMSLGKIQLALSMVEMANKKGLDVSTELYPYTAGSTLLETAVFDDGWREKLGIDYNDLQWVETGERLTEETFSTYRKKGGSVILHLMKPEWIKTGIAFPNAIVASDGMPYARLAHPRTAGTFSRLLGKYVREEKVIDLSTAIEKITLLPAKRLEGIAPMMRLKGRIQVGADADITIFDADKIIDKSTFENGLEFSEGIEFVLVNGVFVIKKGATVEGIFPGQPVYGKFKK